MDTLLNSSALENILQRLDKLQPDAQPLWGKMNANQMICHCSDPIRGLLGTRPTKVTVPRLIRPLMRRILLSKKPFVKNAPTVRSILQGPKGEGTKPVDFERDKEALKKVMVQFSQLNGEMVPGVHPALDKMPLEEAARLMWKHLDHHLRQFGV